MAVNGACKRRSWEEKAEGGLSREGAKRIARRRVPTRACKGEGFERGKIFERDTRYRAPRKKGPRPPAVAGPRKKMILRPGPARKCARQLPRLCSRDIVPSSPIQYIFHCTRLGGAGGSRFRDRLDIDHRAADDGGGDGENRDGASGGAVQAKRPAGDSVDDLEATS